MDLELNNQQRLICHKIQQTKPNLTPPLWVGYDTRSTCKLSKKLRVFILLDWLPNQS